VETAADFMLQSLPDTYSDFIVNYNMHDMDKSLTELHGMLVTAEKNLKGKTKEVLMVNKKVSFKKAYLGKGNAPGHLAGQIRHSKRPKVQAAPKTAVNSKDKLEEICYHCNEPGHGNKGL
jgi:hypothetical protein